MSKKASPKKAKPFTAEQCRKQFDPKSWVDYEVRRITEELHNRAAFGINTYTYNFSCSSGVANIVAKELENLGFTVKHLAHNNLSISID